jgi:hypothetical protein
MPHEAGFMAYLYRMQRKNSTSSPKWLILSILFGVALLLACLGFFPELIERYYSRGIYPPISLALRSVTGLLPFSLGDVLYTAFCAWMAWRLVSFIRARIRREPARPLVVLSQVLRFVCIIYIVFKLAWGFNYDRLGIAHQLGIPDKEYTKEELRALTEELIDSVNACRRAMPDSILPTPSLPSIYDGAFQAYQNISARLPFLEYRRRDVKGTLFNVLGDYMGFTGYYNPFTGEAQLRTDVPRVLIPYIACHEMAHQLGYASESEANFVGYLAASASRDVYFRYSVYLDLFSYAQGEEIRMYGRDKNFKVFETIVKENRQRLDTLVKLDRKAIREFFNKRRNKVAPAVSSLYDQYLKMNSQSSGINSYDEVTGWLIAYRKKQGLGVRG